MASPNFLGCENPIWIILSKEIFPEPAGLEDQLVKKKKAEEAVKRYGDNVVSNAFIGIQAQPPDVVLAIIFFPEMAT